MREVRGSREIGEIMSRKDKRDIGFAESINWEWLHAHHSREDGLVGPGAWLDRIIDHARRNGYRGRITERGALRVINRNLW